MFCLATWLPTTLAAGYACADDERKLDVRFCAFISPVSHSFSNDPGAAEFNTHLAYEADLLRVSEDTVNTGLSFSPPVLRYGTTSGCKPPARSWTWKGGITILDAPTGNVQGNKVVMFTQGHIAFRQSLPVRSHDGKWQAWYEDLTGDVRAGVLAGATG